MMREKIFNAEVHVGDVVEVDGIRFEAKDNGQHLYFEARANDILWVVAQNRGESCWWVWAHKAGAIATLNIPGSPNALPGILWHPEWFRRPAEHWLREVVRVIKAQIDPWSTMERQKRLEVYGGENSR